MNKLRTITIFATFFCVSLSAPTALAQGSANTQKPATIGSIGAEKSEDIIEPEQKTLPVHAAQIDTEKFELGIFAGVLNIEEFNTNPINGFSLSYHITPKILTQASYGKSHAGRAAFEEQLDANFLTESQYDFSYVSLSGGYQLLHGRSFLGSRVKMNSTLYALAGLGQIEFAGNNKLSYEFGMSYRIVVTDWLTMNLDFKDHIFNRTIKTISDRERNTHNTELSIGVNALF